MPDFVIQEHIAKRAGFHHDLRLQEGESGKMESWAIPKGIPLQSGVKRLAIKVEDHPIDYKDFEGTIEEGYGAGTVRTFDEGPYEQVGGSYKSRHLFFNGARVVNDYWLRYWEDNKWLIWKV